MATLMASVVPLLSTAGVSGTRYVGNQTQIFEHWTGTGWQRVRGPRSTDGSNVEGIECPTPRACWVIEDVGGDFGWGYITEWSNGRWLTPANPGSVFEILSMSCPSTAGCVMVGNDHGFN